MIVFGCADEFSIVTWEISGCGVCGSLKWELVKGTRRGDGEDLDEGGEITIVGSGIYRWTYWQQTRPDETGIELVPAHAAREIVARLGISAQLRAELTQGIISQAW